MASTLQRLSGFQVLPPSSLRFSVDWLVESEFSISSPVRGLKNHTPLAVPLTLESSAHVLPSLVPRTLPPSVIAHPFLSSKKKTFVSGSSVDSGSPPSCTCHVFPPSVVKRMVDLLPTTQQVSGPAQAIAFRSMSLLNGTGSQMALNVG